MGIKKTILNGAQSIISRDVVAPITGIVDTNLQEIVTTIGSFVIRSIRGKFQRSISFTVGLVYYDQWMEEALYSILYRYNNIKGMSRLGLMNSRSVHDGTGMYFRLDDGAHNLKYRDYDILLVVQTSTPTASPNGNRVRPVRIYTIITYHLGEDFVINFERDMVANRNSLLRIKKDSPTINVYQDYHEGDGYTYWQKIHTIPKRRLGTVYLPLEQKKRIVNAINQFFASREYYRSHGISHNLKILLYGPPGSGKDSIAKMIASEWNRNLYYITGGKDGKFIPNALTDDDDEDFSSPLLLISDIDKYPYLIAEPTIDMNDASLKDERIRQQQQFGNMINALDGVLSGDGRIIVMTTNHIEKFSEVFLRDGRVDIKEEVGFVTPEVFRKYTHDFYHYDLPEDIELVDKELTVAKLQTDVIFRKLNCDEFVAKHIGGTNKKK